MAVYLGSQKVAFKGGTFSTDGTSINNQNKTVTPTTSQQTITADSGYTGLGTVTVNRIPTNYIIPSGNKEITANGTGIDVAAYSTVSVAVPTGGGGNTPTIQSLSITPSTSEQTFNSSSVDGYKPVTVAAIPAASSIYRIITNYSPEFTINEGTVSISFSGSFPVYCDRAGWITINSNYEVVNSEVTVEISGSSQLPTMTLPTSAASGATSGYSSKATIGRSTSAQYINIPPGYNSAGAYYVINAVANGSATAPSSISGTSATVSTGTNTLTLTKTISVTPTVSAGYVSSGTAGNSSVSLTASVTTKAAATITPGTTNQTIASGTYLTGTQTISGDSNLVAGNIKKGISIFGVAGSYEGSGGSSSMNVQAWVGRASRTANSYGATTATLTVAVTGTYTVSWSAWRSSSSGTMGTNLYKNSTAGTNQQTFTNTYGQQIQLTNQQYNAGDVLTVYATSGSTSRTINVANLVIVQTA